jgi:site-specific DNA-methyltransferase (adenine-specific)
MSDLYKGYCLEVMKGLDDNSIDLILTSPPYNVATKRSDCYYKNGYSDIDNLNEKEYIEKRYKEFKCFEKLLSKNGVILFNLNYTLEMPSLPIKLMAYIIENTGFIVVDYISWKKNNAIPFQTSPRKLSRIVEMIYVIVRKTEMTTYFMNKEISKINEKTKQKFYKNYVNFVEAKNNDSIKSEHKATYSTELCLKLINMYSSEEMIVLDPFMGLGTTGVACNNLNRNFIGIELDDKYFEIAKDRIDAPLIGDWFE